jgi:alanyl-tRNA synthetase
VNPTERLYYTDAYLRAFDAQVLSSDGNKLYLDRTAFYPASGGQPFDLGAIGGLTVEEVIDEDDRIAHIVSGGPVPVSGAVHCSIDWPRRFDHMQQHTGQHLLSAVLAELFDIHTLSFHLGSDASTIDVAVPSLDVARLRQAEERANQIVFENRPVTVEFASASGDLGLRKPSGREGELRIVAIDRLDRSACGGTHVRSTAEIGPIAIRKLDKIRGNVRIEFLCGFRSIRRAALDFDALSKTARVLSSAPDEVPAIVESQSARLLELEKSCRKLAVEAAQRRGRELYQTTEPGPDGVRRVVRTAPIDDELRALAQGFTASPKAVLIVLCADPPSILIAASQDSGLHAGNMVKQLVTAHGGRGGGSPLLGQGSVPGGAALDRIKASL